MLKRIILFMFVLSALLLIALAPMNVSPDPGSIAKLQETVVVTVAVVTAAPTVAVPADSSTPAGGGLPISTMTIFGLLVVLGLAVIIGGMALMRPRQ
jgi:hypothetical protein